MAHFALICPPITGHVEPLAAVGRALIRRGHRATFFHVPDSEARARAAGLEFAALGASDFPAGELRANVRKLSELTGLRSLRFAVECARRAAEAILKDGPEAVSRSGVDALLVDQNEPAGGSVAEHLRLPFASMCTSLPLNRESLIPPPFIGWPYGSSPLSALRNRIGAGVADLLIAPIQNTLNRYRREWGLTVLRTPDDSFSHLAQMAQMPAEFDFPRRHAVHNFHYLGPWFDWRAGPPPPFPFERLDGRPLIYASLGTLQESSGSYFETIANACAGLEAQLVVALGRPEGTPLPKLSGDPVAVNYAPQLELLSRAAVTITHCGMNTTQQSLWFGVPAAGIPLAHDQPGIAARLEHCGAGIVIAPAKLNEERLRGAVEKLLPRDNRWRSRAQALGRAGQAAGGAARAAEIAESLIGRKG